ncbi:hypothetical protein [uncultured Dokdonia sp.]|nr:hypothetical protein [uncultured Dokdonia sp.]
MRVSQIRDLFCGQDNSKLTTHRLVAPFFVLNPNCFKLCTLSRKREED